MNDTQMMTPIKHVGTIFVLVTDRDRALEFYLEKLRFEKRSVATSPMARALAGSRSHLRPRRLQSRWSRRARVNQPVATRLAARFPPMTSRPLTPRGALTASM